MYRNICALTPKQIYELSIQKSWQYFVEYIGGLYEYLFAIKSITQLDLYRYFKRRIALKAYIFDNILDIMNWVVEKLNVPIPLWNVPYRQFINSAQEIWNIWLYQKDYIYYLASCIHKRREEIGMIVRDIGREAG